MRNYYCQYLVENLKMKKESFESRCFYNCSFFRTTGTYFEQIWKRRRCSGHNHGNVNQGLDYMSFSCNFNLFNHFLHNTPVFDTYR